MNLTAVWINMCKPLSKKAGLCSCRCEMKNRLTLWSHQDGGMKELKNTPMCWQRDHRQHIRTVVSPSFWQCPPLCGQRVVSEGAQLVKTGGAKQAVRDKRRWTRYAQRPSTHTTLSSVWVLGCTLDAPGSIIQGHQMTHWYTLNDALDSRMRLLNHWSANICCCQALHLILVFSLIKMRYTYKSFQGAKHNQLGILIACIWSQGHVTTVKNRICQKTSSK